MKKMIRLTEGDLHRIVKESVKRVLKEASKGQNKKNANSFFFKQFKNQFPFEIQLHFNDNNRIYKSLLNNGEYLFQNAKVIIETADGKRSVLDINDNMESYKIDSFKKFMKAVHPEVKLKQVLVPFREESDENSLTKDTYCHVKITIDKSKSITFSPDDAPSEFT